MLRYVKLGMISSSILLTSCSYIYGDNGIIQNRDTDYLKATTTPPLRIPPGISSNTIEAHYPVSEKFYPNSRERINLTPPELQKPFVMPDLTPVRGPRPNIAAENNPLPYGTRPFPNSYYDPYTRASTTKAGVPLGTALKAIWPWGSTQSTQSVSTTSESHKTSTFSWSSIWPWGKKNTTTSSSETQTSSVTSTVAENAQQEETKPNKPAMYYDRYTQR